MNLQASSGMELPIFSAVLSVRDAVDDGGASSSTSLELTEALAEELRVQSARLETLALGAGSNCESVQTISDGGPD